MSSINFTLGLDRSQWKSDIEAARRDILGLTNTAKSETSKMDSSFKNLSLGIAGYFSVNAVQGFVRELINVRGEFQKTEIAFTTMLGNADQAKSLMNDMVTLAAKTPFSLQDVSSGAKQLLAFQVPANEVLDTLTRLGNIAAGLSVPLSRINLVYGQVKAKGKLMGDDLRQFTEAGIPMVAELAKKFGTTTSAITEMVSAGKIGFKDVQDVLFSMTNEGGMFFNLMEKQSKSLSGQIANLGDAWDQMLNKIGEANEGVLSGTIKEAIFAIENYESIIEVIKGLVLTYGAYKTALMLTSVAQSVASASAIKLTTTEIAAGVAKRTLTGIQATLNATILANPYALAAAAITGLIYAIYKLNTQVTTAQEIQTEFSGILQNHNNKVGETKAKIDALVTAIKSNNTTDEKRKVLISQLNNLTNNKIKGLNAESVRTGQLDAQIKTFIKTLYQQAEAMSYVDQLSSLYAKKRNNEELKNRAKTGDTTIGEYFGALFDKDTYKKNKGEIGLSAKALISARVDEENKAIDEAILRTKKEIDKRGNIIANAQNNAVNNIATGTDATTEIIKKQNEEVEKIYGADTIKGLQQRISKLNEVMETSVFGSEKYNIAKSQKTALEARLKEMTKSFDDEIAEIERQWKVRYALEEKYGNETAKAQFSGLKGDSYYSDIKERFSKIDAKLKSGVMLSDEEIAQWQKLKEILDNLNGVKDPFTNFKENLDKELSSVSTSFEKIEILKNKSKNLTPKQKDNGYLVEVNNRIEAEFQSQESAYQEFLKTTQSFEEKRTEIAKKYAAQRQKIYQDSNLSETQKQNALISSDKLENSDISEAFANSVLNDPIFTQNFEKIGEFAFAQFDKIKAALIKKLEEARNLGLDENSDVVQRIIEQLNRLDEVANRNPFSELINDWKKFIDSLKNGESDLQGIASKVAAGASMVNKSISVGLGIAQDLGLQFDESTQEVINDVQTTVAGVGDLAAGIASKNPMQIIKGIAGIVKGLAGLFNGDRKKEKQIKAWANEVNNLKLAYEELERAVSKALGEDKYKAQQTVINNLKEQKRLLEQMMQKEIDKKKTDQSKVNDYKSQIASINAQIEDIQNNIIKNILQTDAQSAAAKLGDALVEAFSKGEDGAKAMRDVANDMFKDIVKNALNMKLEKAMQPILNDMLKAIGYNEDGTGSFVGLSSSQMEEFRQRIADAGKFGQDFINQYAELFQGLDSSTNGLKGDIKGITEKTAGALESQINAIRIYQVEALNISKRNQQIFLDSLRHQAEIAYNTRELKAIRIGIDDLNIKIRKGLAL